MQVLAAVTQWAGATKFAAPVLHDLLIKEVRGTQHDSPKKNSQSINEKRRLPFIA